MDELQKKIAIAMVIHVTLSILFGISIRGGIFHLLGLKRGKKSFLKLIKTQSIWQRLVLSYAPEETRAHKRICEHMVLFYHFYIISSVLILIICIVAFFIPVVTVVCQWGVYGKLVVLDLPFSIYFEAHSRRIGGIWQNEWDFK